jgi:phosphoribosylglycinamide formyltransferase 1
MVLGILGSGSGSNMQAILDAIEAGTLDARIALVLSDNPDAFILERARRHRIPTGLIDCRGFKTRFPEESQRETADALRAAGVDLVCLAGFLRLVKRPLLDAFPNRILNIHPSLLPAFPGLESWKQALAAGVPETGCTVHFVDEGMDTGPVILRETVPVLTNDTAESLHARIQQAEHRLYPAAIATLQAR